MSRLSGFSLGELVDEIEARGIEPPANADILDLLTDVRDCVRGNDLTHLDIVLARIERTCRRP